jgi:hypothetical protein
MDTTLNIHEDIAGKITDTALSMGIRRSDLIVLLLHRFMEETGQSVRIGRLVQYQKRRPAHEWRRVHAYVEDDEYEIFLDMRKLTKRSLSYILAIAVERYLDDIVKEKFTDNNRNSNYIIIKEEIDSIPCWMLIWGNPPSLTRHFRTGKTT